jgi:tetratricopeptide (TPR) repeat protein
MRAQALFMETIAIAQDVNPTGLPYLFNLTGRIARYQGDFETAREQSLQGLALSRKLKTKRFAAQSLYNLAWIAQHEDDNLQAGQYFAESVRLYVDVGDKAGIAECIEGFARAQNLLKKSTFAAWLLGAVEALRENIHVPIPPIDRTEYDRTVSAIGSFIDESTLVSVWEKGRMTPIEHVIAVVIGKAKEPDI